MAESTFNVRNGLAIGKGVAGDQSIEIKNGDANSPALKYDDTGNAWQVSNDGVTFNSIAVDVNLAKTNVVNTFTEDQTVNANIITTGTVDGRDVGADGTKLDFVTITQAVDLDTVETDTGLNNTHRGVVAGNPHSVTATDVGLGNVDNTSDANKPVSDATQTALNAKEANLTKGNLTELTSSVLDITGGTGAVIGTGLTIKVNEANTTTSGYITNTDWNTFNEKQASLTFGIADTNSIVMDDADAVATDYARITASGIEGRDASEIKTDLALNNVENTAISTFVGSSNIATVGTVTVGTWTGDTIAIANGGTGQTTAQASIDALTGVSGATDEYVLTKDTTSGSAEWKVNSGGSSLPVGVHGDIIYKNASAWVVLNAGETGQVLQTQGTGADPSWKTLTGGSPTETVSKNETINTGANVLDSFDDTVSYNSIIYEYDIIKDANKLSGVFYLVWNGTADTVDYNNVSNTGLGTIDVTMSADISSNKVRLIATSTSDGWTITVRRKPLVYTYASGMGYYAGGTGSSNDEIGAFTFEDNTNFTITAVLSSARYGSAGVNSDSNGYVLGGYTSTYVSTIDGIQFSDDTAINPSAVLSQARYFTCGVNSENDGYAGGGYASTYVSTIDGIQFSDDTAINPAITLSIARRQPCGVNSSSDGYFMGGGTSSYLTTIDGVQFSDDTAINPSAVLSVGRSSLGGVNSSSDGYAGGGYTGSNSKVIDGIQFSDDTAINPSATLSTARDNVNGNNSTTDGYFLGGGTSAIVNVIQFSDDTVTTPSLTLVTARSAVAGFQSGGIL